MLRIRIVIVVAADSDGDHGLFAARCRSGTGSAVVQRRRVEAAVDTVRSISQSPYWRAYLPAGTSSPVVTSRGVFATSDFNVYALDRTSGDSVWTATIAPQQPPELRSIGAPIVREDTDEVLVGTNLYRSGGLSDISFRSFDARTGVRRGETTSAGISGSLPRRPVGGHGSDPTPFWRGDAPPTRGAQP